MITNEALDIALQLLQKEYKRLFFNPELGSDEKIIEIAKAMSRLEELKSSMKQGVLL